MRGTRPELPGDGDVLPAGSDAVHSSETCQHCMPSPDQADRPNRIRRRGLAGRLAGSFRPGCSVAPATINTSHSPEITWSTLNGGFPRAKSVAVVPPVAGRANLPTLPLLRADRKVVTDGHCNERDPVVNAAGSGMESGESQPASEKKMTGRLNLHLARVLRKAECELLDVQLRRTTVPMYPRPSLELSGAPRPTVPGARQ